MISTSLASEKNTLDLEPMHIDATQYKPLSQGKKDRHCQEELCYYCGNSKHRLSECSIKPKRLKAQNTTSMESGILESRDVRLQ